MNPFGAFVASALLAVVAVTPVSAQAPEASHDQHHPGSQTEAATPPAPTPIPGTKGGAMPMMDMCRQMMGDLMGMPMMGGAAPADPKERAEALQMRGEMMKAMGDIMMKHARRIQGMTEK